ETIAKWVRTEKGPDKLRNALGDGDLDPDLCAHAGQHLIRMGETDHVVETIGSLPADQRDAVLAKLVPRLWEDARLSDEMAVPTPPQSEAKDALFELRRHAQGTLQSTIDEYLIDWLTGGYY